MPRIPSLALRRFRRAYLFVEFWFFGFSAIYRPSRVHVCTHDLSDESILIRNWTCEKGSIMINRFYDATASKPPMISTVIQEGSTLQESSLLPLRPETTWKILSIIEEFHLLDLDLGIDAVNGRVGSIFSSCLGEIFVVVLFAVKRMQLRKKRDPPLRPHTEQSKKKVRIVSLIGIWNAIPT